MANSNFDEMTQSLWNPIIEKNVLVFVNKYGDKKLGSAEDSLIYENDLTTVTNYQHIIDVAPYNPVNPIQYIEEGCPKCGSKYLKYVRMGEDQKVIFVCSCSDNVKK